MYQVMPQFPYGSALFRGGFGQDVPPLPALPELPEVPGTAAPRASTIPILAVLGGAVLMIGGLVSQRTGTAIAGGVIAGVGVASYPWWQEAKRAIGVDGFASGYGTYG